MTERDRWLRFLWLLLFVFGLALVLWLIHIF